MKNTINEKNKLPLTFKYLEFIKRKKAARKSFSITYYVRSERYQTDFLTTEEPYKPLVRLI
ncbi:hypothetical protein HHL23_14405 [Chryseobacterium sp. RP-3-3]|uniref:Uncharacterized protein n=1 Tax=Chryseobacterium antibioticum TaxID=2728847 RepID=A0A7Y0FS80_9FLAO|nr:hypothetical protein [Chryseobacterium antibioticum]NML70978.1 hypothetical protein [Chryseobacterium antibioticum]